MFCEKCGAQVQDGEAFCYACGAALNNNGKKKCTGKVLKRIVVLLLLVAVATGVFFGVQRFGKKDTLLYLKDNEIMQMAREEGFAVSDEIYEDESAVTGPFEYSLANIIRISEDGKYIYYPQNNNANTVFDLYRKKLGDEDAEDEKIASDVTKYCLLKDGRVLYIKDATDKKLYVYENGESEKIDSGVNYFYVSADEKTVLWTKSQDDVNKVYASKSDFKEKEEKIISDFDYFVYLSEDYKNILYFEDGDFYALTDLEDEQKIASEPSRGYAYTAGDELEIYYCETEEENISYMDLIYDDLAAQDKKISEPDIKDYQHTETKQSYWGPREVTVTDDAYYDELEKYEQKLQRDYVRENLKSYNLPMGSDTMYQYNQKKDDSNKVAEGLSLSMVRSGDYGFLYTMIDKEDIEKVPFSELLEKDIYEVETILWDACEAARKLYAAKDGKSVEIPVETEKYGTAISCVGVDENTGEYYIQLYNVTTYESTVFKTDLNKMDGELKLVTEKFGTDLLIADEGVYYTADADEDNNYSADLYFNDEKIDSDVVTQSIRVMKDGKGILYLTDRDEDILNYSVGTLKLYKDGETIELEDDVVAYQSNENGNIAFLMDYNFEKFEGDLMLFKNGKAKSIDDDVAGILYFE